MFDHHSRSFPCQAAIEAMMREVSGEERLRLEEPIFALVGAPPEAHFSLTSSGAEAIQQVIWSAFIEKAKKEGKNQFITSCVEDAPFLQMLKRCEELGAVIKLAPVDREGRIDGEKLKELITPRTALITLSIAQGLTGVVQPFDAIGQIARERGVLLHWDLSWAIGKMPLSFADLHADFLTFAGGPIHSMQGTGALFARRGVPLIPYILGAPLNLPALAALSAAARLALLSCEGMSLETARLRSLFEEALMQKIPGLQLLFPEHRLPNTSVLLFPRVHHEALFYFLTQKKIFPNQWAHLPASALSFSLSRMTTEEEVAKAVPLIAETVSYLQKMSEDLF